MSAADHEKDLGDIFKTLQHVNMKVQLDKWKALEKEEQFLCFIEGRKE